MSDLSPRQRSIMDFIRRFRQSHPYGPTIREIRDGVRLSSTSVALYNVRALRGLGVLSYDDAQARTVHVVRQVASQPVCPACHNRDFFRVLVPSLVEYEYERGTGWRLTGDEWDVPSERATDGQPYRVSCERCGHSFECQPWS